MRRGARPAESHSGGSGWMGEEKVNPQSYAMEGGASVLGNV